MSEESAARRFSRYYEEGHGEGVTTHHRLVYQSKPEIDAYGVESILDVGCGRGQVIESLEAHGYYVAGTEIAQRVLEKDLKRKTVYPVDSLKEFEKDEFDLVLGVDLVECMDVLKASEMIQQMWRVARLGILLTHGGSCELHQWRLGDPIIEQWRREISPRAMGSPGRGGSVKRIIWWKEWMV